MTSILSLLALCLSTCTASFAQIAVELKSTKKAFVVGEPVNLDLSISNSMGLPIELKNRGNMPWLDINIIWTENAELLPQARLANFPPLKLPTGKKVSRRVDMRALYDLVKPGYYYAVAYLRSPDGQNIFTSAKVHFSIQEGKKIWEHTLASPNGDRLNFKICTLAEKNNEQVYVQLSNADNGAPINTICLGNWLSVKKPSCSVDPKLNLHVLFPVTPKYYSYACVDKKGNRTAFSHYQVIPGMQPRLLPMPDGSIRVDGAIYVDPKAPGPSIKDATMVPK